MSSANMMTFDWNLSSFASFENNDIDDSKYEKMHFHGFRN